MSQETGDVFVEHTKKPLPKWLVPLLAILILALAAGIFLYLRRDKAAGVEILPEFVDETHIGLTGAFTVTGAGGMDLDELRSRLVFDPPYEFRLSAGEEDTLRLQTFLTLEAGSSLSVALLDAAGGAEEKRWEFRTEDSFRVVGSFPADGAQAVPPSYAIELSLSYQDIDEETLADYITLTPDIPFYTSTRNNLLLITPEERSFPPETEIGVTVSGELPRENGGTLGADYSFSFTTGAEDSRELTFSSGERVTENILPGEEVLLMLSVGEELQEQPFTTRVYRYDSADDYRDALREYRDALIEGEYRDWSWRSNRGLWQPNTEGLPLVLEHTGPSVQVESGMTRHVVLPETLEPGWYAATVETALPTGGTAMAGKLIQVSPLSVYHAQHAALGQDGANRMVAWVNDTAGGQPVEGAVISVAASNYAVAGQTDGEGVAVMDGTITPLDREGYGEEEGYWRQYGSVYGLLEIAAGEERFLDMYGDGRYMQFSSSNPANAYMTYLFTDRPLYRPTDTVKVWGLITPRREETVLPGGLRLSMGEGTASVPVSPGPDGTFQTEVELDALAGSRSWLSLEDDAGTIFGDIWLRIEDFVKPVYQTTATTERPFYTAWQDPVVEVDFTAAYFEGTPAREYRAVARKADEYRPGNFEERSFATDANGRATVAITPLEPGESQDHYRDKWRPQPVEYGIFSDEELNAPQVQGGLFYYFYRDVALILEKGSGGTVTAYTWHIDTSRIGEEADLLVDENLLGAPADVKLTAEVHKTYNIKTPSGERYDPISKQSVTAYDYEYTDEVVDTITVETKGGEYRFSGLPESDGETGYYVKVTAEDTRGLPVIEELTYSKAAEATGRWATNNFTLVRREPEDTPRIPSIDLFAQGFVDGETLDIYLTDYEEEVVDPGARMLYMVAQDDILDYGTVEGTEFQLPYSERYLPNYILCGAYFDGKHVYATNWSGMQYVPDQRELEIAVEPEREKYGPGETAAVRFKVTEKQTGEPAGGAKLVAAVVDEAIFAMEEQTPEFLKKLYKPVFSGTVLQYTSYNNHNVGGGGYGGGGDGPFAARTDFQDTAAFTVLTTGADGTASLDVPLPDNLTSWRVTALALDSSLKAGDTKGSFAVSKDFFVTPVLPARLLAGDDLVVTAHSAGDTTDPEEVVSYTGAVEGTELPEATAQGRAGSYTPMALGAPDLGSYRVTVSGTLGDQRDAVTLPLDVVESGINVTVTRQLPLAEAGSLESTTWPVTLGFYDKKNQLYMDILDFLVRYGDGARVDQHMAGRFVMETMGRLGLDDEALDTGVLTDEFEEFCPDGELYRLFPYAEDDAVLTARIHMTMPSEYLRGGLNLTLETIAGIADPAERAAGYLLFYPQRSEGKLLREALEEQLDSSIYTLRDRLYLVLALCRNGGEDSAKQWFARLTESALVRRTDADGNELLSLADERETAAALLVATELELPEAAGLARQLTAEAPVEDLGLLELAHYLQSLPAPSGRLAVSYTLEGEAQTAEADSGVIYRAFSREQLAGANFSAAGEVWVSARYTARPADAAGRENAVLSLSKSIEPAEGGTLAQGGLAKITLRWAVPESVVLDEWALLTIEDYVSTGMRYERLEEGSKWYLDARNDQRVRFTAALKDAGELVFYARCVAPGSYVSESAFFSVPGGTAWGMSERGGVVVAP